MNVDVQENGTVIQNNKTTKSKNGQIRMSMRAMKREFKNFIDELKKTVPEAGLIIKTRTHGQKHLPEYFLPVPVGHFAGLWIAFDPKREGLEIDRMNALGVLMNNGYQVRICHDIYDARWLIMEYLNVRISEGIYLRTDAPGHYSWGQKGWFAK